MCLIITWGQMCLLTQPYTVPNTLTCQISDPDFVPCSCIAQEQNGNVMIWLLHKTLATQWQDLSPNNNPSTIHVLGAQKNSLAQAWNIPVQKCLYFMNKFYEGFL